MSEFILFYLTWCPACQHFKPIVEKAMRDAGVDVVMVDLQKKNSNRIETLQKQNNIDSGPVLVSVRDGTMTRFNEERSVEEVKKFLKNNGGGGHFAVGSYRRRSPGRRHRSRSPSRRHRSRSPGRRQHGKKVRSRSPFRRLR